MKTKDEIRQDKWDRLETEKLGGFPFPLKNRIPNFKGAAAAAEYAAQLEVYKKAEVIKINPDAPQLPLRARVIKDGKTLLVPTPRLKAGFIMLKREWVPDGEERRAVSLKNIKQYGKEVPLSELPRVDLIVAGSVAVHKDGRRIGKGEGYSDREYAIMRELGNPHVPVISTIHSIQVTEEEFEVDTYDLPVDYIVTELGVIETNTPYSKPDGIHWDKVTEEEKGEMPVLNEIWELTKNT
ncbi:5-formyltetrahydrofolate cyclo-ligase [Metabacillus idriensis]|uniref:5-formyltetrahydrofolate cyclo-ligase n=1 Tax=Metabacillus idriensis TaxID=324768 RepID=A0A6I2MDB0_9BACI|nr:5-formyltetrahydrofolate cyclo-ligase [Metabacillus idriensis]MCM3598383.1 5-formyltetrahydrofolate cyclo-ligase [Metabacillus idriensis]MRX54996.1 5-formyltetrahydrofolate cyclo-ligase [Metabacillus idriensis]OHR71530.1 5-formyltetrahydrofolate cyclo-ligase [Bacillus sp. HMSC76G11]